MFNTGHCAFATDGAGQFDFYGKTPQFKQALSCKKGQPVTLPQQVTAKAFNASSEQQSATKSEKIKPQKRIATKLMKVFCTLLVTL